MAEEFDISIRKRITFRNMDHSEPMENYINTQLVKVEEFISHEQSPIFLDVVLEPSKVHAHNRVEVRVKTKNYDLISNYEGPKMYDVIDRVVDITYRDLLEAKRKLVDKQQQRRVFYKKNKGDDFNSA